jgi:hypothetical protein
MVRIHHSQPRCLCFKKFTAKSFFIWYNLHTDIKAWLSEFTHAWSIHEIDKVLSLFDRDVEYWETPHKQLHSFEELKNEWQSIVFQKDIQLKISLYSSIDDRHTVIWYLKYLDQKHKRQTWSGTYLVTLNKEGLCTYFHHTGEKM